MAALKKYMFDLDFGAIAPEPVAPPPKPAWRIAEKNVQETLFRKKSKESRYPVTLYGALAVSR